MSSLSQKLEDFLQLYVLSSLIMILLDVMEFFFSCIVVIEDLRMGAVNKLILFGRDKDARYRYFLNSL